MTGETASGWPWRPSPACWKPGVLVEDWRIGYNSVRPHYALGWLTPTDDAKAWATSHPELSERVDQQLGPVSITVGEGLGMSAATGHDPT
jgi:Integrase core domain